MKTALIRITITYVSMDRPVEKMHVNELKELLRSKNVSLNGITVKAQLVAKYVMHQSM